MNGCHWKFWGNKATIDKILIGNCEPKLEIPEMERGVGILEPKLEIPEMERGVGILKLQNLPWG